MLRTTTRMIRSLSQQSVRTISRRSFSLRIESKQIQQARWISHSAKKLAINNESKLTTKPLLHQSQFSFSHLLNFLGMATAGSMAVGTGWLLYHYGLKNRETPIVGSYIDLSKDDHHGLIVSNKKFKRVGDKVKGDLSGAVVEDEEHHTLYLKKGAIDHLELMDELVIADFLNMVRPNDQPRCIIIEEMQETGKARFYTLSEILPNSMDLEDFLLKGNWREELDKIPMVGLGEALAGKLIFGTELKLANMLMTKKKDKHGQDCYVVTAIDHERPGEGLFSNAMFTSDPITMLNHVKDFGNIDDNIPLSGTQVASEFRQYAIDKGLVKEADVIAFYKKMIAVNPKKMDKIMRALDGDTGVMTHEEHEKFKTMIEHIQQRAHEFLVKHEHIPDPEIRKPSNGRSC